jgi:hypothetical protein
MAYRYRWRSRADLSQLEQEIAALKSTVLSLRRELGNKQGAKGRLKILLRERLTRIDNLTAQVDQLRHLNKKLDAEAEHYAALLAQN